MADDSVAETVDGKPGATADGIRHRVGAFIDAPSVQNFIIGVIVFNAILLGLQTSSTITGAAGDLLVLLDEICLAIFVVELALRLFARGLRFFRSPWNVFDALVVGLSLLPDTGGMAILRSLRILRALRLVARMPSLRLVIHSLLAALPGVGTILMLILLVFYISSVIATTLFGSHFPEWFGTLGRSLYTLFQVMTLESWSMGIVRPVMEVFPYAWAFFLVFILTTTFVVLNLFIAVIIDAMNEERSHEREEELEQDKANMDLLLEELRGLRAEVRELKAEREKV